MFQLQVDIASRGAQLLRPGGTMVYSTCSIDPVENEAVIAEMIQKCPWMEVIEIDESNVDGLVWHQGLTAWSPLDEQGKVSERPQDVPFFDERYLPPSDGAILNALSKTRRLYPQDNNTGGFFVALLRHREDATPEGVARTFIDKLAKRREESGWESRRLEAPKPNRHTVHGATQEEVAVVMQQCRLDYADYSWWKRGKRMAIAPPLVYNRMWAQETPNKRGDRWPEGTFHPLQVLHVGLPAFVSKNGNWRARRESIPLLYDQLSEDLPDIDANVLLRLLKGEALEPAVVFANETSPKGAFLLRCQHETGDLIINAWCGERITLMLDKGERRLLSIRLNLEEEE